MERVDPNALFGSARDQMRTEAFSALRSTRSTCCPICKITQSAGSILHEQVQPNLHSVAAPRHPSLDRRDGRCTGQPSILHPHARFAAREEERQPGRRVGVSFVLRRRPRLAGFRPDVLRLARPARAPRHAQHRAHRPARRQRGQPQVVDHPPRKEQRHAQRHRPARWPRHDRFRGRRGPTPQPRPR